MNSNTFNSNQNASTRPDLTLKIIPPAEEVKIEKGPNQNISPPKLNIPLESQDTLNPENQSAPRKISYQESNISQFEPDTPEREERKMFEGFETFEVESPAYDYENGEQVIIERGNPEDVIKNLGEKNTSRIFSPDPKKLPRNLTHISLGETLFSEYVPGPLGERRTSSKSSSSKVDMADPSPIIPPHLADQQLRNAENYSQSSVEEDLRNSDLRVLMQKREQQASRPIRFNVMVVGESGLGKSTFIDAFLEKKYVYNQTIRPSTQNILEREGTRIYNGVMLRMAFIDTPGYGANKEIEEWYQMIKEYVVMQFENYKEEKQKRLKSKKVTLTQGVEDRRVHALLYFIAGPRINQKDLIYMKKLKKYCNIIPILAKGDSYTVKEIREMKLNLIKEAYDYKIDWFDFAEDSPHKLKEITEGKFGPSPPFLIISSLSKIQISENEYVYGREYTWGICNIENPNHSDFTLLQTLLGGHICLEAVQLTHYFYKDYFKKLKEKRKEEENDEKKRNIGVGAIVAFGLFGALMAFKKKLFN